MWLERKDPPENHQAGTICLLLSLALLSFSALSLLPMRMESCSDEKKGYLTFNVAVHTVATFAYMYTSKTVRRCALFFYCYSYIPLCRLAGDR